MPWLWRPLWGTVWIDGDRAGKENDGGPGDGKEGTRKAAGEGEQQVKNWGSMPKWGGYVGRSVFNPYQTIKKQAADKQESEVFQPDEDAVVGVPEEKDQSIEGAVDEVLKEKNQPGEDAVNDAIEEKDLQKQETGGKIQIIESMSRQFEEVSPGVFQFKRSTVPPAWRARQSAVARQPVRADAAWYRSALPSAIADYHQVGQTRDGLPIYSFK